MHMYLNIFFHHITAYLKHCLEMTYRHATLQVVAQILNVLVLLLKRWTQEKRNASVMSSVRSWISNYRFHRPYGHPISMRSGYNIFLNIITWKVVPLLQALAMESYGFETGNSSKMSISSNLLKVQAFFTTLSVESVTESATYEVQYAWYFK